MFLKEYRICLPMSVEEYRIAQLYMILKKSREETHGEGSGIEILVNEAYEEGPGGKGQYTHKIYHIGSHLPGWFRSILPKSALIVEEKSWNAYPYTKTIYRCPFIEKFTLAIETRYYCDGGHQDNVFGLTGNELRNRVVDYIDIVKDPISSGDYKKEEDPRLYQSRKTGRGPLGEDWRQEYTEAALNPYGKNQAIMCAYKLCRVEFKYWGMQSKIERFIHDIGLRKTMVRAHRQAWAWQDEWFGLTIDEIRRLEHETQLALQEKMACSRKEESDGTAEQNHVPQRYEDSSLHHHQVAGGSLQTKPVEPHRELEHRMTHSRNQSWSSRNSGEVSVSRSPSDRFMESLEQLKASSSDEDEFFDAQDTFDEDDLLLNPRSGMMRSSSMEIMTGEEDLDLGSPVGGADNEQSPLDRRMEQYRNLQTISGGHSLDSAMPTQAAPPPAAVHNCKTTILFLILHGGSVLDVGQEVQGSKHSDITTFKATLETVLRAHYPAVYGHIAVRFVPCPAVCADALSLLTSLSPFSHEAHSPGIEANIITNESLPMGAISLLATAAPDYQETVASVIAKANAVYNDFLRSEDGLGFTGQVCFIGDSTGSIIGYDMLCRQNPYFACRQMSRCGSQGSLTDMEPTDNTASVSHHHVSRQTNLETIKQVSVSNPDLMEAGKGDGTSPPQTAEPGTKRNTFVRHSSCPASRRTSTNSNPDVGKLDFDVSDFFMFGSPLALVLAFRKMLYGTEKINMLPRPLCHQMYNLFYTSDPTAARLEPLLVDKFRLVAPMKLPRYQKFPLGDGSPVHLVETIQSHSDIFIEQPSPGLTRQDSPFQERRSSNLSISSQLSGNCDLAVTSITSIAGKWWGNKRLDFALYCPDALQAFPTNALPYLLHASYWESTDVMAFILRQVVRHDSGSALADPSREVASFQPGQPREKWLKRRTTIKLRNVAPNHRANDVLILEDREQVLTSRFMYGPLDMVSLSGEKVDIHLMKNPPDGEWVYLGTDITDSGGRVTYTISEEKKLPQGMYPVKMVVRGDHTSVDFYLTVLPPKTEAVVFSIDGSFTASVSIMGKDPKVRAGAVDVVRHWQELGFLIIYITARPDMQHKKVVAWLAQHNFPHGMVSFIEGITSEPLKQKSNYLRTLTNEAQVQIHAAYGSAKDISVYQAIGLTAQQIYIVGKVSKKHAKEAQVLAEGYAAHLNNLTARGGSRPATGNARMFIRKSCFSLPGQQKVSKRGARRTVSLPHRVSGKDVPGIQRQDALPTIGISEYGNTVVEPGGAAVCKAARMRGLSPRGKHPH